MPLSFTSKSHGNIAFGFFNIESDMLLLENYFFFADDFCQWIDKIADKENTGQKKFSVKTYHIADPNDVGDLMGAIHGIRFTGFIGKMYELFPFPADPQAFKQNPDGFATRKTVKSCIKPFAVITDIIIELHDDGHVKIGPYLFDEKAFNELLKYVWQGGYPRWKDERQPDYVTAIKKSIKKL